MLFLGFFDCTSQLTVPLDMSTTPYQVKCCRLFPLLLSLSDFVKKYFIFSAYYSFNNLAIIHKSRSWN